MTIPGLKVDLDSATPVYRQIADGVRAALVEGALASNAKLPPTRDLARQLGVNRNTVIAAYDLLAAEGLVESHTGKGTFLIAPAGTPDEPAPADDRELRGTDGGPWFTGFSRAVQGAGVEQLLTVFRVATSQEGISFAGTYPAGDLLPIDEFSRAMSVALKRRGAEVLAYGTTAGYPALREAIAAEMRDKGSPVRPEGLLITNGAQQAIDLVFRTLLDRGDAVVLEEPTYTGALSALNSLGARMIGVPLDDEGIRPDLLALALERHRPRLIYLQPTFQNPTTALMGEARRREVLALAERHRCVVVEDDWASDLQFEGERLPTLHALDGGRRVIYLSTFSKNLLPGLRVGWLAAPPRVLERLIALKQVSDFGTSPLVQAALHCFLESGGLDEHLRRVIPAYRRRRDRMIAALERQMPEGARFSRPSGGLFVWATLPGGMDANELSEAARDRGVLVCRGDLFHGDGSGRRNLRLAYGGVTTKQIDHGMSILGGLLRDRRPGGPADAAQRAVEAVPIL